MTRPKGGPPKQSTARSTHGSHFAAQWWVREQGTLVVHQPLRSMTLWGAQYTRTLDAIKPILRMQSLLCEANMD